jgi:hypothetical protein
VRRGRSIVHVFDMTASLILSALEAVPVPPWWGVSGLAFHMGGAGYEDVRVVADQAIDVPCNGRRFRSGADCVIAARERRVRRTRSLHDAWGCMRSRPWAWKCGARQGRILLNSKSTGKSTMVSLTSYRAPNCPVNSECQLCIDIRRKNMYSL